LSQEKANVIRSRKELPIRGFVINEAPDFYIYSEFNEVKEFKVSPIVPLVLVLILLDNTYHGCPQISTKRNFEAYK